jgi:hypothetical protein
LIIVEHTAVPSIGIGEGDGAIKVMQDREIGSGVHHVEIRRSPRGFRPIDHAGDPIAFPQDVSGVEVTMHQPLLGRRRISIE